MKKASHRRKPEIYVCRKCDRRDFRTMMEFTRHLKNCRVIDTPVTQFPFPVGNTRKAELLRLQALSGEMYSLTTKLLKGLK